MYVPVMKNRTVEVGVLQKLSTMHVFDGSIIPLVELIQEKTRSNNKHFFILIPHFSVRGYSTPFTRIQSTCASSNGVEK